ncbi:putative pentatricopeptide repeat-containing protein At3g16890, mitochondrial [Dioscorea cayenensis subsp. rotundata]|uniref:Pentatricopeptide repeat-containing protein At3g16890, mitochondrial n=1 Tax=Dioscorea cayennensis subsp. rotundata TaxID=55577 RepID=A0AB40AK82_DIOCR|nr:putative pentatricopeptide repeat-containing protein At3g16890, mitochondrial [Dioscorea cayenensis subsp. rotundata]XP_039115412.1 putative pentatricopeptide repeat-containing protein At3g16890, mitochondrial [Dioscorea cayenensis subsp. rotundata]
MRGFPSPKLRSSSSTKFPTRDSITSVPRSDVRIPVGESPLNPPKKSLFFRGSKASDAIPDSKSLLFNKNHEKFPKFIDPDRLCVILSQKDWFLMLNTEFKSIVAHLGPQSVVSVLQKLENPLFSLKFYIWASNLDDKFAKDRFVRKVLVELLWRKGPVVLSVELVNEIRSSTCGIITEDLLSILMCSWGRLGLGRYANEVFGQMSFLGLKPTTKIFNAVIDALVKSNSLDLAYFKFQQMPSENCSPDRFTYNILIHGVCRLGIVGEALRLVKQMERLGHTPNVFTYTMLVDGFCNAKKVDEAFRVLDMMARRKVAPSDATYRSLINGTFRCLETRTAYEMLCGLLERETALHEHACGTLLHCLSMNGMGGEAIDFIRRMSVKSYLPDTTVFGVVIACAVKNLGCAEVCELMDDFVGRGGRPGFNTYLTIITYLLQERKLTEADRFVNRMVLDELVCSVVSYNMLIDCFVKAEIMEIAMGVFKEMLKKGFLPNLVTYNTLISGHSKVGDVNMARDVLKMLLEHGFKPDVFTFSSIIDGLCRVYQIDDAFDCFHEMAEWGVPPNAVTYNILIRSLCIVGDVHKSMKLLKMMREAGIDPDVYSFNALILNFCKTKKMDKAQNLFDSMLRLGVVPDRYTYNAIIEALCDAHKIEEAKETLLTMEANDCAPDLHPYSLIINALSYMGRFQEAQELVSECEGRGISVDSLPTIKIEPKIEKVVNS